MTLAPADRASGPISGPPIRPAGRRRHVRQWPAACSSAAGSGASAGSPWSTFARSWMTVTQGGRKPPALPGDQRGDRRQCQTPVNCIYIQHAARQADITAQDLRANRTQHEAHASAGRDNQRSYAKIRPGQRCLDDTTAETSALRQALSNPLAGATERPFGCGKDGDSGWPRLAPERRISRWDRDRRSSRYATRVAEGERTERRLGIPIHG